MIQLSGLISGYDILNPLIGIEKVGNGRIVVKRIYDISDVFAQITVDIPLSL